MKTKEIVQHLQGKKWRKRGTWPHYIISSEIFGEGETASYCQRLGYPFKRTLGIWYKEDWFDPEEEWEAIGAIVTSEYKKDPAYLWKYGQHCLQLGEETIRRTKELGEIDPATISNEELGHRYREAITEIKGYMPFMFSLHLFDKFLTEKFEELLSAFIREEKLPKEDYFKYQTALTLPNRKIFVLQEKVDLMKIALLAKKKKEGIKDKAIQKKMEEHTAQYGWINMAYLEALPHDKTYFHQKVQALLETDVENEYNQIASYEKKLIREREEYMNKIQRGELHTICKAIQLFGFLRSFRLDTAYIAYYNCWKVIQEIEKRLHLPVFDIRYLDSKEVSFALQNPKEKGYLHLIQERKRGVLSIMIEDTRLEITGEEIEAITREITFPKEILSAAIKGTTAYPGRIIGPCKVLHRLEDMQKMCVGDILVIAMTDPNYIPAMEKAAAFVTDQGGILCHAAIVSREMKKPCIIGTKSATKSFKDKDILEVNADEGIVRKIDEK